MYERTLMPVIVAARDAQSLPARMTVAWADVLEAVGVSRLDIDAELAEMRSTIRFRTTRRARPAGPEPLQLSATARSGNARSSFLSRVNSRVSKDMASAMNSQS
ncbi:hypothetical protein EV685_2160 [Sphaerotilus mobilis]|uniref:Uncharacterized protein n=1 Tax=Sphaerotilus mobilis TaxID=47994 RepID=A0A4Q7LLZ3_9BURK|nr:hypothetical protein EV685_2160 [Sphaerotilus mobilis]